MKSPNNRKSIINELKDNLIADEDRPVLKKRVLILNRNYQPLTTNKIEEAIKKLFNENGSILDIRFDSNNDVIWNEYTWSQWLELIPKPNEPCIRTPKLRIKIPEVIKLSKYHLIPHSSSKLTRKSLYKRDNFTCMYCGKCSPENISVENLTIDHVIPKSRGGLTRWDNVVIACGTCNQIKGDKFLEDTNLKLIKQPYAPKFDVLHGHMIKKKSWEYFLGEKYWAH